MLEQYSNKVLTSLFLWAENRMLNLSQAYITKTTKLYQMSGDPVLGNQFAIYSSPFKQWVYDSGVLGSTILSSVSGAGITINRGEHGMIVDYDNGRILLDANMTGLSLTGTYSFKEVNFYLANEGQEPLLSQEKMFVNPKYKGTANSGIPPYTFNAPAVFISSLASDNKPFAFGGMDMSTNWMTLTVFTESAFQLDNIMSVFVDSVHHHIPIVSTADDPIGEYGDLKFEDYTYGDILASKGTPGNLMYVEEVNAAKISSKAKVNQTLFVGMIDMKLTYPRFTNDSVNLPISRRLSGYGQAPYYIVGV